MSTRMIQHMKCFALYFGANQELSHWSLTYAEVKNAWDEGKDFVFLSSLLFCHLMPRKLDESAGFLDSEH